MKKLIVLLIVCTGFLIGCKNDDEVAPKPSPLGFWKGMWSNDGPAVPPDNEFLWLLFRTDGTVRVYYDDTDTSGSNKSTGTYSMVDDSTVTWTVPEWGELSVARIRNNSTKMVGTWGISPSSTDEGQLEVTKQ